MTEIFERIIDNSNLNNSFEHIKRNNGASGIDGITIKSYESQLTKNLGRLALQISKGKYNPKDVRRVKIPKESGGFRTLGIPTVRDRIIQQAILNIIEDRYDKDFEDRSFGFRKGKGAHRALNLLEQQCMNSQKWTASVDISSFFNNINRDKLLNKINQKLNDKKVMKLIRIVLTNKTSRCCGIPQGGPLSPLLANIYLDSLDKILIKRNLNFIRYADDIIIIAGSKTAAQRNAMSITRVLKKINLESNEEKTKIRSCNETNYLGLGMRPNGLDWTSQKINIFKQNFISNEEKKRYTESWMAYFGISRNPSKLDELHKWCKARSNVSMKSIHQKSRVDFDQKGL